MRKLIVTAFFSMAVLVCFAQQEQQYTQFMYNKLSFNPGYAGSYDGACLTGIFRKQWIGLEGAPQTVALSFDMPLMNKRVGVGLNLSSNKIGISNRVTIDGMYTYRIPLGRGTLGIGVQGSVRYMSMDYGDSRLIATEDPTSDSGIPIGEQSKYVPNFGGGIYYHTPTFYFGLSAPRFLKNNIDFNDANDVLGREVDHIYAMAGILLPLNEKIKLQPQVLLKYADNTPFDVDVNVSAIFNEKYTFGMTYRAGGSTSTGIGESIDLLVSAYLTNNFMFGISYDFTLSDLKAYNSGSMEAILRYCFNKPEGEDIINPRFF